MIKNKYKICFLKLLIFYSLVSHVVSSNALYFLIGLSCRPGKMRMQAPHNVFLGIVADFLDNLQWY